MAFCLASKSQCLLLWSYVYGILCTYSQTVLPMGITHDDWIAFNEDTGWTNGDIITTSTILNKKYHGLFDGDTGETLLSRDDIVLETSATLSMNFTLILGCQIIETTDKITVTVGTQLTEYYMVDTFGDYPYITSSGFTINTFNTDPIFNTFCNTSLWYIKSSVTSKSYTKDTPIYIAFESSFNYQIPYDGDDKYWGVTDIVFDVVPTESLTDDIQNNAATIVILIVICAILFILFIILCRYCRKSKKVRDRKRNSRHVLKSLSVQLTEPETNNTEILEEQAATIQLTEPEPKPESSMNELEEHTTAIQQNKQLKSELSKLQIVVEELRVQNRTIDTDIKTSEADIHSIESSIIRLNEDIANKEKMKEEYKKVSTVEYTKVAVDNTWMVLSSVPHDQGMHVCLVGMNYREFGAVIWNRKKRNLYKYGGRDQWRLFMECPDHLKSKYWIACGDRSNDRIFMYGNVGEMVVFNTKGRTVGVVKKLNKIVVGGAECVMMDGRVHIMGGVDVCHMLWNTKADVMKQLRMNIGALDNNKEFGLVGLKKPQRLLLFGGRMKDDIYQYSFDDCSWMRLNCVLPFKMHSFGYVVTSDGRYIVLFGGIRDNDKNMDDIFVWSVDNMIFKRAKIRCPVSGELRALLMDYRDEYEIILCGMMRECMIKDIGHDIFQLIMIYTVTNDVHLMHSKTLRHWRISMESII